MANVPSTYFLIKWLSVATLSAVALALGFHVWLLPPQYQGWSEVVGDNAEVAGWVVNLRAPDERVMVQLYIEGRFAGTTIADLPRPDVVRAGFASDERCGYRLALPRLAPGTHVARVYVVRQVARGRLLTRQGTGEPLSIIVTERAIKNRRAHEITYYPALSLRAFSNARKWFPAT